MNWITIRNEFVDMLNQAGVKDGFNCRYWPGNAGRAGSNIVELSGTINCLIYFKIRSEAPYRWGVTRNRLEELMSSRKPWFLVLLYDSPHTGYLISSDDVSHYLTIWPLGSDGDYKVAPGSYLQYNKPFTTFAVFISLLLSVAPS